MNFYPIGYLVVSLGWQKSDYKNDYLILSYPLHYSPHFKKKKKKIVTLGDVVYAKKLYFVSQNGNYAIAWSRMGSNRLL